MAAFRVLQTGHLFDGKPLTKAYLMLGVCMNDHTLCLTKAYLAYSEASGLDELPQSMGVNKDRYTFNYLLQANCAVRSPIVCILIWYRGKVPV